MRRRVDGAGQAVGVPHDDERITAMDRPADDPSFRLSCEWYGVPCSEALAAAVWQAQCRGDLAAIRRLLGFPVVPDDDRDTAYHEAGHVVVAWRLGLAITGVSIEPQGRDAGRWGAEGLDRPRVVTTGQLDDLITILLASEFGAMVGTGTCDLIGMAGESLDAARYGVDLERVTGISANVWCSKATERASRLVRELAPALHALAGALLERRTLTGQEAISVLETAMRRRPWWRRWMGSSGKRRSG